MSEEIEPHILRKFEIIQKLGKGAYGIVWKAIDRKMKQVVALKKVFDAFHNATDAQRTFREVMFLQELNGHENIIRLLNIIKAENNKDLYLVFDFMETDLHAVIRANILEEIHKKNIVYQTLKAIKYIHSGDLIHRDLKPSNILLNSECLVKVADFGLARSVATNEEDGTDPILTEYVATRWYRAPEILLGSHKYTKAVDMWSVGCILGELIIGKACFPGTSTLNQIERVLELTGKPKMEDVLSIESALAENIINSINISKKRSFQNFFPNANEESLDLLQKLLAFNPKYRLTVDEALKHRYVKDFVCPEEEIVCNSSIKIPINDNKKLSIREYREALYNDIAKRKKVERKKWQEKYLKQLGVNNELLDKPGAGNANQSINNNSMVQSTNNKSIINQIDDNSVKVQNNANNFNNNPATVSNYNSNTTVNYNSNNNNNTSNNVLNQSNNLINKKEMMNNQTNNNNRPVYNKANTQGPNQYTNSLMNEKIPMEKPEKYPQQTLEKASQNINPNQNKPQPQAQQSGFNYHQYQHYQEKKEPSSYMKPESNIEKKVTNSAMVKPGSQPMNQQSNPSGNFNSVSNQASMLSQQQQKLAGHQKAASYSKGGSMGNNVAGQPQQVNEKIEKNIGHNTINGNFEEKMVNPNVGNPSAGLQYKSGVPSNNNNNGSPFGNAGLFYQSYYQGKIPAAKQQPVGFMAQKKK